MDKKNKNITYVKKLIKKGKINAFMFDPSTDEVLEDFRNHSFPRTLIRKIKNSPSDLSFYIKKNKRLFCQFIRKIWFFSRKKSFNLKIYYLIKSRKFFIRRYKWKQEFLNSLKKKISKYKKFEKSNFQEQWDYFANEIMEAEAGHLRLVNLERNT